MTFALESLRVRYGTGRSAFTVVDGVSLSVAPGATVGLVGESGCGKSTLARAAVGLVPVVGGRVLLDGRDVTDARIRNSREFRRRVQMVFQDPFSSFNPRMTIGDAVFDVLTRTAGVPRSRRRAEALRLLDMVGLPASTLERYPHQFSGGQRQRISIARALAVNPEVIIHDEVTSALDVSVQATILNLLKELQRELQLAYVFISHDLSTVRYMSDEVSVMYLGRIVEHAPAAALFARPRHPYTRALMDSFPHFGGERTIAPLVGDLPDPRHPPRACRFQTRCPQGPLVDPSRTICTEVDPQDGAPTRPHEAACHFAVDAAAVTVHLSGPGIRR